MRGAGIRLGQLLKLAGIADSGGEAKELLAAGGVLVDGAAETRRGRMVGDGALVSAGGETVIVRAAEPGAAAGPPEDPGGHGGG